MSSLRLQIGSLLLPLLLALPGWTQTGAHYSVPAASVQDQFAAYHEVLNNAADDLLATASTPAAAKQAPFPQMTGKALHVTTAMLRQFARQYWNGEEENVRRALDRVRQLRPTLEPILRETGVPPEVAAIVLVESGGRTTALSPKGALGLWQFMPETARRYGLLVTPSRDERTDAVKSTRAAARYLHDLYLQFGSWKLAFAAYNAGEQTVQRAVDRSTAHDFQNLVRTRLLPAETRNYVPAVFSAVRLLGGSLDVEDAAVARTNNRRNGARVLYAEGGIAD